MVDTLSNFLTDKGKHTIIVSEQSKSTRQCTQQVAKAIKMYEKDADWNLRYYKQLFTVLRPLFEQFNLIEYLKFPLTPNNSQYCQNILRASDNRFRLFQSCIHSNGKLFSSYNSRVDHRRQCQLETAQVITIRLPTKHKQTQNSNSEKQVQMKDFAMWSCEVSEALITSWVNNINSNKWFRFRILLEYPILCQIGGDRSLESYISSITTLTTDKSASAQNSVPVLIVSGNCDDGSESLNHMQNKIPNRRKEMNELMKFPSALFLVKYYICPETQRLSSRYVTGCLLRIDEEIQVTLDQYQKETKEHTIPQPVELNLLNDFGKDTDEKILKAQMEQLLSEFEWFDLFVWL